MKKILFIFATCIFCALQNTNAQNQNGQANQVGIEYDCGRNKTTIIVFNGTVQNIDSVHIHFEKSVIKSKTLIKASNPIMITDPKCRGDLRRIVWFVDGKKHSKVWIIKPAK